MALNNEFKVKNNLNTLGKILSAGVDLLSIFAPSNTSWTLSATNAQATIAGGESLQIRSDNGVDVKVNALTETLMVSGINATTSSRGVASFDSDDFSVINGAVSIRTGGVDNDQLKTASTSNTANYLVIRGASGEFSSGSISVTGSVTTTQNLSAKGTVYGTKLNVDNVEIDGNTITTLNPNGNIIIDPNGTGVIDIQGNTTVNGTISSSDSVLAPSVITTQYLSSQGPVYSTKLNVDNVEIDGNTITTLNANGNLTIDPNGTGVIDIQGNTTVNGTISSSNSVLAPSVITTQYLSSQGPVYSTKLNVDSVEIDGNTITTLNTNGNLIIDPNGTGVIDIQGNTTVNGTISSSDSVLAPSVITTQYLSSQGPVYGTKLNIDNVEIDGNTITTLNTNGNLIIDPNGTGAINIQGNTTVNGTISSNDIIYSLNNGNSTKWWEAYTTLQATSAIGQLTSTVTTDLSVGNISAAQVLPVGLTFQQFVERMFNKTYYPTFTAPSIQSVSSNIGTSVESGTTGLTITVTFLSGSINGKTVAGIWDPGLKQDNRSGILTGGQIFGVDLANTTSNTIVSTSATRVIADQSNTFSVRADYLQGPQPVDSKGNIFSTPLPAGSVSSNVTVTGFRRLFAGTSSTITRAPTSSDEVRAITTLNTLNPQANTAYDISVPVGATRIVFAYPNQAPYALGNANGSGSEPAFKDITNNFDYTNQFNLTTVSVSGLNGFTPLNYNVYTHIPAVPIPGAFTIRMYI